MLDTLITNKTRIKLLVKFFLNPDQIGYLRGLEQEIAEGTNSIRIELSRLESAGLLLSQPDGNKKVYRANREYPLYKELRSIALKHYGIDTLLDMLHKSLGGLHAVYLSGELARGLDSPVIDLVIVSGPVDRAHFYRLMEKVERLINRSIRALFLAPTQLDRLPEPNLLVYEAAPDAPAAPES